MRKKWRVVVVPVVIVVVVVVVVVVAQKVRGLKKPQEMDNDVLFL